MPKIIQVVAFQNYLILLDEYGRIFRLSMETWEVQEIRFSLPPP